MFMKSMSIKITFRTQSFTKKTRLTMDFSGFSSNIPTQVVFASLVVAVFFLIAGAIMLTLGIIKFNEARERSLIFDLWFLSTQLLKFFILSIANVLFSMVTQKICTNGET